MPSWNTPPPSNNEMSNSAKKAKAKALEDFERNRNEQRMAMLKHHRERIQAIYNRGEQALIKNKKKRTKLAGRKGSTKGPNMNPRSAKRRRTARSGSRSMNGGTRKK